MPRLLFIDDHRHDFDVWGNALKTDYDWDVAYAPSPTSALVALQHDPFDVVIIDRQMPDPTTGEVRKNVGDELLSQIVARWQHICPIMLTNFSDLDSAQRATKHGAYYYFAKPPDVGMLNHACRKGMLMQFIKKNRHVLLNSISTSEISQLIKSLILGTLDPAAYCLAYLCVGPGGALLAEDLLIKGEISSTAEMLRKDCAFVEHFPCVQAVMESRRYHLKASRAEIVLTDGTLINTPGSQMIVPVLRPAELKLNKNREAIVPVKPRETKAIIWIESGAEGAFDREDADMFSELAEYVAIALPGVERIAEQCWEERKTGRDELRSELAHRICNPLQIAQSNVDLVVARLRRNEKLAQGELQEQLSAALESLEQAIQVASEIRQGVAHRIITFRPTDISTLVDDVISASVARASNFDCEIQKQADEDIPLIRTDKVEMRYILECVLDNAIEAIERERARTGGNPKMGEIKFCLATDQSKRDTVLLSVQDNGSGVSKEDMPMIFDKHFSTKELGSHEKGLGLGLWEAKRFLEKAGSLIEIGNRLGGGTSVRICLPTCAENAEPEEIIL